MSTVNYTMFKCFNRKFAVSEQSPPQDVKEAFSTFADGVPSMSADQLHRFLLDHQLELDCTAEDSQRVVDNILHSRKPNDNEECDTDGPHRGITLDEFFHFMFLVDFNAPLKSQVHHDMNAPLSHYFIYTGHNSYLTGNQLSSDCSDVPIIKALQQGVRVIELDVWPNSTKDDVVVVHGRTLTAPVSLIQCLKSIKEYAFVKSDYPVIITLEDHLTPDLQAKVADMTTQIFGDMLYYPQTDLLAEFPTPESLKGRILISTKPPKEYLESKQFKDSDSERESTEEGSSSSPCLGTEVEFNGSDLDEEGLNAREKKPDQQSALEYKRLITIHAGKPKGNVRDHLNIIGDVKRLSLSEQELEKASASYGSDIVRFTQKNIIRVYPKGTRVNSSNYRPHIGWIYGAQMVAFNMQGHGRSLWYMQGMFRSNGGCGYVKKPAFLLEKGPDNNIFDPKRTLPLKTTLKVKVYLGNGWSTDFSKTHFDAFSPPDFYTKVCIVGVPADNANKKTRVIQDNWFPVWEEEFEFPLTVPELALLRIEVREYDKHEKDDFGGQTCLPISELRSGFRVVSLNDEKGEKLKSVKLLMRFQFSEPEESSE
ncbi:phosphoinositide phospholipase C 6-like isoform X2 [Abrus precatorius]|uniref:Phosphoinositide phospholipase C n=1 Tax=Abrus precatorius TaxID=3816 RepID=A0A8B8JKF2_ABRPR|nr:phosphoinositide phospholipase C 6-like isoform X2 [Abrus precatorius]